MKIDNGLILSFLLCTSPLSASEEPTTKIKAKYFNEIERSCFSHEIAEDITTHSYLPKNGYVPNKETAIKIALAVWEPIYGKKQIADEKPYKVKLQNGVWRVNGSLKPGWKGGVAEIEICKQTAQVIRLSHGK